MRRLLSALCICLYACSTTPIGVKSQEQPTNVSIETPKVDSANLKFNQDWIQLPPHMVPDMSGFPLPVLNTVVHANTKTGAAIMVMTLDDKYENLSLAEALYANAYEISSRSDKPIKDKFSDIEFCPLIESGIQFSINDESSDLESTFIVVDGPTNTFVIAVGHDLSSKVKSDTDVVVKTFKIK